MPKVATPPHIRFESKFKIPENTHKCWLWAGAKSTGGYGKMISGSRTDGSRRIEHAHRFSYKFYKGPITPGLWVLHKCDVRACVNPHHLYLGTPQQNVLDAVRRGHWIKQAARIGKYNKEHIRHGVDNPNYRHGRYVIERGKS